MVALYDAPVVNVAAPALKHGVSVRGELVGADLHTTFDTARNLTREGRALEHVALPDVVVRNELRVGVERNPRPEIADLVLIVSRRQLRLFLADEGPNLVHLQALAANALDRVGHEALASAADAHDQLEDRVAMHARHALGRANGSAFGERAEDCRLLVDRQCCHES